MIKPTKYTLADSICDLRSRKVKSIFFKQINELLDWDSISKEIEKYYLKGQKSTGKPAYDGLLLFKICLLQTWYGLSDYEVEDRINDSLSFSYFCGMAIDEVSPDHSTISRFRSSLTKQKAFDSIFKTINKQLEANGILVKQGAIIDASIINTPLRPKGRVTHNVTEDRIDSEEVKVERE